MVYTSQDLAKQAETKAVRKEVLVMGFQTPYWDYPAIKPNAKTIVFLHGYRGNHKGLEAIMGALPEFHIIAPDLPGFGDSAGFTDDDYSMANYSRWVVEFISAMKLEDAILLGHSFSTMMIAEAAASNQLGNNPLILLCPVSKVNQGNWAHDLFGGIIPMIASWGEPIGRFILSAPFFVYPMSALFAKTKDRKLRAWIHAQHLAYFSMFANTQVIGEGFKAGLESPVNQWAANIKNPTLLFITGRDWVTKYHDYQQLVREFPLAQVREFKDLGHLIHYEVPNEIADRVREFLAQAR
ncbi:MAG: alpha/beta fold hydrolase [Micrococcales bacterium]